MCISLILLPKVAGCEKHEVVVFPWSFCGNGTLFLNMVHQTKPGAFTKLASSSHSWKDTQTSSFLFSSHSMDNEKILESLDSNWFFSNVFNPPSFPPCNFKEPPPPDLKQPEPNIQIHQTQHFQSLSTQIQTPPLSEASTQIFQEEPSGMLEQARTDTRISKQGSKRRGNRVCMQDCEKMKVFLELGFVLVEVASEGRSSSDVPRVRRTRDEFERSRSLTFHCRMPPYNDGLVMKKHLRSWAYAVACTVR